MLTKSKVVVAAVLILGAASAAQAGSDNQSDPTRGFAFGPMGQRVGGSAVNPVDHRSTRGRRMHARAFPHSGRGDFAYVPSMQHRSHLDK
jgi:hypothetical protein